MARLGFFVAVIAPPPRLAAVRLPTRWPRRRPCPPGVPGARRRPRRRACRSLPARPFVMVRSMVADEYVQPHRNRAARRARRDRASSPRSRASACSTPAPPGRLPDKSGIDGMTTTYTAEVFDETVRAQSAACRSPASPAACGFARWPPGGLTVFETGHSYSEPASPPAPRSSTPHRRGHRSSRAFAVTHDGAPFRAVDFNFWGVTFAVTATASTRRWRRRHTWWRAMSRRAPSHLARRRRVPVAVAGQHPRRLQAGLRRDRGIGWHLTCWTWHDGRHGARRRDAQRRRSGRWLDDGHVMYHLTGLARRRHLGALDQRAGAAADSRPISVPIPAVVR